MFLLSHLPVPSSSFFRWLLSPSTPLNWLFQCLYWLKSYQIQWPILCLHHTGSLAIAMAQADHAFFLDETLKALWCQAPFSPLLSYNGLLSLSALFYYCQILNVLHSSGLSFPLFFICLLSRWAYPGGESLHHVHPCLHCLQKCLTQDRSLTNVGWMNKCKRWKWGFSRILGFQYCSPLDSQSLPADKWAH